MVTFLFILESALLVSEAKSEPCEVSTERKALATCLRTLEVVRIRDQQHRKGDIQDWMAIAVKPLVVDAKHIFSPLAGPISSAMCFMFSSLARCGPLIEASSRL